MIAQFTMPELPRGFRTAMVTNAFNHSRCATVTNTESFPGNPINKRLTSSCTVKHRITYYDILGSGER